MLRQLAWENVKEFFVGWNRGASLVTPCENRFCKPLPLVGSVVPEMCFDRERPSKYCSYGRQGKQYRRVGKTLQPCAVPHLCHHYSWPDTTPDQTMVGFDYGTLWWQLSLWYGSGHMAWGRGLKDWSGLTCQITFMFVFKGTWPDWFFLSRAPSPYMCCRNTNSNIIINLEDNWEPSCLHHAIAPKSGITDAESSCTARLSGVNAKVRRRLRD